MAVTTTFPTTVDTFPIRGQVSTSHVGDYTQEQLAIRALEQYLIEDAATMTGDLTLVGKLKIGSFASPFDVTATRQYGVEVHTSGNNYSSTAIRARGRVVTTDTAYAAQGAVLQAANSDGINAGALNGALIEAIGKSTATAATIAEMRGCLVNTEWSAFDTVTNLKTLYVRTHTRDTSVKGYVSTSSYMVYIENEAVGGNGQVMDAGIYFKGTRLSAGNKAFTYAIDMDGITDQLGTADIRLSDGSVINDTNNAWDIGGKITCGSFASPLDVTATRQHGVEIHYSGNNYNCTAIRARGRVVTTDTTAYAQGALLQAANSDGIDAGLVQGALIEGIGKSATTAAAITTMRGCLVNTEWDAKDTITNLRVLHVRTHTRDAATEGYVSGTSYMIYIENEAVGGNGQVMDAGIFFEASRLSAGNKAYTYAIDMSGIVGELGTADIRMSDGSVLGNTSGNSGFGAVSSPTGKVHIDQASTTAAIPALKLDQGDVSEGFIDLVAASAGSTTNPLTTWTTGGAINGFFRVEINGVSKWVPYYTAPTS